MLWLGRLAEVIVWQMGWHVPDENVGTPVDGINTQTFVMVKRTAVQPLRGSLHGFMIVSHLRGKRIFDASYVIIILLHDFINSANRLGQLFGHDSPSPISLRIEAPNILL